jgi:hypothetical protein
MLRVARDRRGHDHPALGVLARRRECSGRHDAIARHGAGEPHPGRYKMVPAPMNGEPAARAHVRAADGRFHAVCLAALSLDSDGCVVELTTFVLPELFAAWGFPPVVDV